LSSQDARKSADEVYERFRQALASATGELSDAVPAGLRTATCSALGHLELARLDREDFLQMTREFPVLGQRLVGLSLARLRNAKMGNDALDDYVAQGLYEGQSILVLDLDRCTRCDQCTRGCIEEHGSRSHGTELSRLLRDGMRYGHYLVATSCRSCTDAHCMTGCPVDSIHRGKHQQIVIEDHCIGCGLCASNCPYGSIFMVPNQHKMVATPDPVRPGRIVKAGQLKAAACDLCDAHGHLSHPEPQCVASCPHDAAFRMSGPELLERLAREG
jgi:Fe-S-cluster-containing hydrogenase component 2